MMDKIIQKVEARLADRRGELEEWGDASQVVVRLVQSEIDFLEGLLAEMNALDY